MANEKKQKLLTIEYTTINSIKTNEHNCRTHSPEQVDQIAESIKVFGFTNPLLVDGNGKLIAGEGRYWAAKKLKLSSVPVIRLTHLNETQKQAYLIADNKIALNSGWNVHLLAAEIMKLQDAGFDMDAIGFSDDELKNILSELDDEIVDDIEEGNQEEEGEQEESKTWKLGSHTLIVSGNNNEDAEYIIEMWEEYTGKKAVNVKK